jgi:methylase of polypeptide subunit release factors
VKAVEDLDGAGLSARFHRQVDPTGRRKIMDLGGGSGCYCIVAVQTYSGITAEVLDPAPVITVTREFLVSSGGTSV